MRELRPCSIDGCAGTTGQPGTAHGWCLKHYRRWYRTGSTDLDTSPTPCIEDECREMVSRAGNGNVRPRCESCKRKCRAAAAKAAAAADPDGLRIKRRAWRSDLETQRRHRRTSYGRHRDRITGERRVKYRANPEPVREQVRQWARLNPSQIKEHNRRYADRVAAGTVGPAIHRPTIYARDNWTCQICFEPVDPDKRWPHPLSASLDHIIPVSIIPIHTVANVQLAHLRCNQRRGNKI